MGKQIKHLIDEADIGSGEKTPVEQETDQMIEQLGHADTNKPQGRPLQQKRGSQKDQGTLPRKGH